MERNSLNLLELALCSLVFRDKIWKASSKGIHPRCKEKETVRNVDKPSPPYGPSLLLLFLYSFYGFSKDLRPLYIYSTNFLSLLLFFQLSDIRLNVNQTYLKFSRRNSFAINLHNILSNNENSLQLYWSSGELAIGQCLQVHAANLQHTLHSVFSWPLLSHLAKWPSPGTLEHSLSFLLHILSSWPSPTIDLSRNEKVLWINEAR